MTQFSSQKITLLLALLMAASSQAGDLQLEKAIPLSGVESRIDHFSVDVPGQRLFVAALGNGSVEIVDLKRAERIGEIRGLPEPQGTYYDSTTGRLLPPAETAGFVSTTENRSRCNRLLSLGPMQTTSGTIKRPATSG